MNRNRRGQSLLFVTLSLTVVFGLTSLIVDFGVVYHDQNQLNASAQAAVLAGAEAMAQPGATTTTVTTAVQTYSGASGDDNADGNLTGVSLVSGYNPKLYCSSTMATAGIQCVGPGSTNAIAVAEQVKVPIMFARFFGLGSLTLTATATAAMRASSSSPYNVAMVLDTTHSMNNTQNSPDCTATALSCALSGIKVLLQNLSPCASNLTSCGGTTNNTSGGGANVSNSVDRVSLLTFPAVPATAAVDDYNCSGTSPGSVPYATPFPTTSTYQIVNFSSDYRTSDSTSTLNSSSNIVEAVGGKTNCAAMTAPGGQGTYYAQVVAAAQAYLVAEQKLFPNSKNVMILLSDGDADATCSSSSGGTCNSGAMTGASTTASTGAYPPQSTLQQCHQAIAAAQSAWAAGTTVYAVNFGAEASGCASDTNPAIAPCQTMLQMATYPAGSTSTTYFSDDPSSGADAACVAAARPTSSLNQIFQVIAGDFKVARLIPNGTK